MDIIHELLQLDEIGTGMYTWEWVRPNKAVFDYGEADKMEVTFRPVNYSNMKLMDVSFKSEGTEDYAAVDAKGKEIGIMGTIIAIIHDYWENNKDQIDGLSAEGAMDAPGKRNRLYGKMMQMLKRKYGGVVRATGAENYWLAPKEKSDKATDLLRILHSEIIKFKTEGEFWDEKDIEVDGNKFHFEDANLFRGGIINFSEGDSDVSFDDYFFWIDLDKMMDLEQEDFEDVLDSDLDDLSIELTNILTVFNK